jgi:hypothetical protein
MKLHQMLPNAKIFISTVGIHNMFLSALNELKKEFEEDFIQLQFRFIVRAKRNAGSCYARFIFEIFLSSVTVSMAIFPSSS